MSVASPDAPTRRLSVPLTAKDEADLRMIRESPEGLSALGPEATGASDAALVHAVFEEGLRALRDRTNARIYQQMGDDIEEKRVARANRARLQRRVRDTETDD